MSDPPPPERSPPPPAGSHSGAGGQPPQASSPPSSRSLNPNVVPFPPSPGAGPCFSIPSVSEEDEEELLWSSPRPSSKGNDPMPAGRAPSPPRRGPGGFMAEARHLQPRKEARAPRSHVSPADANGFREVVNKRRLR